HAIPADRRVARRLRLSERVDERAIHRPIELSVVARFDRTGVPHRVGSRRFGAPARGIERGDLVRQLRFARLDALETGFGLPHFALRLREARRALAFECAQPFLFTLLVRSIFLERVLEREKPVAIFPNLVAQLLDSADERSVAKR